MTVRQFLINAGDIYGRWTVLSLYAPSKFKAETLWLCRCVCGTERPVVEPNLLNGKSKSCGCYSIDRSREVNTKHGETLNRRKPSPEYHVWKSMNDRCNNPNNPRFADYGGRGIGVDPDWQDYRNFIRDMGVRTSPKHSIDRLDNNLNYGKDNCQWSLAHEQMTNRRNSLYVEGVPLSDLARKFNIPANTLRFRILKGWDLEDALTSPVRPKRANRT